MEDLGPITVVIRGRTKEGLFKETTTFDNDFRKITIPIRKILELECVEILRDGEIDMDGVTSSLGIGTHDDDD